jgi:ATP-binding cassette subfamily D (ALD) long-chain fatty acid import protein
MSTNIQSIISAYFLHKPKLKRALYIAVILGVARRARSLYYTKAITTPPATPVGGKRKGKRDGLDPKFMAKLTKLLRIVIPSWFCKESALIALFSGFLVTRTMV